MSVPSTQLDPAVVDASTLQPRLTSSIFLPIGIEGQKEAIGTAVVGTIYRVARIDEANSLFGPTSELSRQIKQVLDRGAGPVVAIASKSAATPTLAERQAEWAKLESDENVRIRLTDSLVQADVAALAVSCKNADLLQNKQFCMVGMASGTSAAALEAAADAIAADAAAAKRAVLLGPGVYDELGTLRSGGFAAACVAAEVAKNADPSLDLDLWTIPYLTAIEKDGAGLNLLRRKVVVGAPVNEYENLLQQGVSPLQPARGVSGGVMTTHLRMVFHTDTTFDNLYTRIIIDQVFLDVKNYILDANYLRLGNTVETRARIKSGVEAVLFERRAWIEPIIQGDGTPGYNVSVVPSLDERQITISYQGEVVRGISTIQVAANLTIAI